MPDPIESSHLDAELPSVDPSLRDEGISPDPQTELWALGRALRSQIGALQRQGISRLAGQGKTPENAARAESRPVSLPPASPTPEASGLGTPMNLSEALARQTAENAKSSGTPSPDSRRARGTTLRPRASSLPAPSQAPVSAPPSLQQAPHSSIREKAGYSAPVAPHAPAATGHRPEAPAMPPEPDRRDSPGREPARQSTPPPAGDPIATQAQQPLQEAREAPSQLPRDLAPLATNLAELRAGVAACRACKLCETRTNTVFMDGSPNARVMFIGEGPGYQEDVQGVPFVGPPGQLLTDIIQKGMGLRRADVAITNVVKCRPPENRDPSDEEMALCSPWLDRQIDLVAPEIIISLGPNASGHILGVTASMGRLRSQIHDRGPIKIVPTFHPSYLLRAPEMKKESWKDIQLAMRVLGLDLPGKA